MAVSEETQQNSPQNEAETGFGTGLRGKLEKRREPQPPNGAVAKEAEAAVELLGEPQANGAASSDEADALRAELAASIDRERELRAELSASFSARDEQTAVDNDYAARSAELDVRAARLASTEQEIELREARLSEQLQNFREERERLSELETRLTASEALTSRALRPCRVQAEGAEGRRPPAREACVRARQAGSVSELAGDEARPPRAERREPRGRDEGPPGGA